MITLLVRNIGELVTCDPERGGELGIVRNAVVAAVGETIVAVTDEKAIGELELATDVIEVDADGAAVIPGFVDSHTHLTWLGDRSNEYSQRAKGETYEQIAAAGGGIRATVKATAAGLVEQLVAAAQERALRMQAMGTTTVEIKSGYGLAHDAEMRSLDAAEILCRQPGLPDVISTYLPLHAAPDGPRADFLDNVCTRGVADAAERATFVDAFCETGVYTVAECERFFSAAQSAGLKVKVHAEQRSHLGGAQLAARQHAVSADHLEHTTPEDHRALATAGVVAVLLPGAALELGGPPPPGRALIDAGAKVAIATDCNPGTCYCESMPLILSLAVATCGMTPDEALIAATRGGAAALALADRGMLRVGLRCDLSILRTPHWLDLPYHLGGGEIDRVICGGVITT